MACLRRLFFSRRIILRLCALMGCLIGLAAFSARPLVNSVSLPLQTYNTDKNDIDSWDAELTSHVSGGGTVYGLSGNLYFETTLNDDDDGFIVGLYDSVYIICAADCQISLSFYAYGGTLIETRGFSEIQDVFGEYGDSHNECAVMYYYTDPSVGYNGEAYSDIYYDQDCYYLYHEGPSHEYLEFPNPYPEAEVRGIQFRLCVIWYDNRDWVPLSPPDHGFDYAELNWPSTWWNHEIVVSNQGGWQSGYEEGYRIAKDEWYAKGRQDQATEGLNWFDWIVSFLGGVVGGILSLELMPGLSLGIILAVPLVITIAAWVIGLIQGRKRGEGSDE